MKTTSTVDKTAKDTAKIDKPGKKSSPADSAKKTDLPTYLKGVKAEWTKISWPTWPQIWGQTIVVLVMTAIMTLAIWCIDVTLRLIIDWITP